MLEVDIKRSFAATQPVLLSVRFKVLKPQILVVSGPSGSGKSTFLKMLSGLLTPDEGIIQYNDVPWYSNGNSVEPKNRKLAYMFQEPSLFPNMTFRENLLFASEENELWDELLDVTEMKPFLDRYPGEMSGGQLQRADLVKCLVQKREFYLLDEPLSSLDERIRKRIQSYLIEFQRSAQSMMIMVSHDSAETLLMADSILLLGDDTSRFYSSKSQYISEQYVGKSNHAILFSKSIEEGIPYFDLLIGGRVVRERVNPDFFEQFKIGDQILIHLSIENQS